MIVTQPPCGTQLNRSHPLSQGLVGCWLMNEGGGQKAFDSVGGRNIGTLTNGAAYQVKQLGSCVSCDGTNDYISQTTISSVLNLTSSCSFSYWLNINAQPATNVWFRTIDHYGGTIASSSPYGYFMGYVDVSGTKNLALYYGNASSSGSLLVAYTLTIGSWYNIVMIHNDSTDTDSFYVNGVLVGSGTGKTQNPASKPTSPLYFMSEDGTGKFVKGYLKDVKIYNRPLSGNEVQQLYTNPYQMFISKKSGL